MALVAYSDESDLSETEAETVNHCTQDIKSGKMNLQEVRIHSGIDSIIDEDEDFTFASASQINERTQQVHGPNGILSSLPDANLLASREMKLDIDENSDVLDDVPTTNTWEVTREILEDKAQKNDSKKKDKKIKFVLPALSEFNDLDDEDPPEEPPMKKPKPSSASGLFALLPSPKSVTKPEQLIPNIVNRPKQFKPIKPIQKKHIKSTKTQDSDEEETFKSSDFFSLSESSLHPQFSEFGSSNNAASPLNIAPPDVHDIYPPTLAHNIQPTVQDHITNNSNIEPTWTPDEPMDTSPTISLQSGIAKLDKEALIRLTGKRNKDEIINLVDINADDALMSREELMTRTLTEEKPTHSYSRKRDGIPSHQQRRKHQITFLAHQAKEKELELKNTWSQNRLTKMQTQAKYGF